MNLGVVIRMSKSLSVQELMGPYDMLAIKNKNCAFRYKMTIKTSAEFSLEEIVSGQFGSTGTTWEGRVVPDQQGFVLRVEKNVDWSYTFLDEERSDRVTIVNNIFTLILVPEGIQVNFDQLRGPITFKRVPEKEEK